MQASLYLSYLSLSLGCFQNSSLTGIAFLSFPLTCWELLNRTEPSIITATSSFLLRSISFFFLLIARLFDPVSCWMASAHWSVTLHQQPCPLSPTQNKVAAVWTKLMSLCLWNELLWAECLCLNLVMLAEVRWGLLHFSLPVGTSPGCLIWFKVWNLTVMLPSAQGTYCCYFRWQPMKQSCDSAAQVLHLPRLLVKML